MVIVGNGLAGVWALGALKVPALRRRALWWFTAGAEVAMFVQVVVGVTVMSVDDIKPPQFHMFYGFVAVIAIAIVYSYRHQMKHRIYELYGFGGLFIMGLGIRAMMKAA